jgi:hypothetical protein
MSTKQGSNETTQKQTLDPAAQAIMQFILPKAQSIYDKQDPSGMNDQMRNSLTDITKYLGSDAYRQPNQNLANMGNSLLSAPAGNPFQRSLGGGGLLGGMGPSQLPTAQFRPQGQPQGQPTGQPQGGGYQLPPLTTTPPPAPPALPAPTNGGGQPPNPNVGGGGGGNPLPNAEQSQGMTPFTYEQWLEMQRRNNFERDNQNSHG